MLSHANLIASGGPGGIRRHRATEEWLCYLPMAWVGDALYSTVISLLVGFTCNMLLRHLHELGPQAVSWTAALLGKPLNVILSQSR